MLGVVVMSSGSCLRRPMVGSVALVMAAVLRAGGVRAMQSPATNPNGPTGRVTLSIVGTTHLPRPRLAARCVEGLPEAPSPRRRASGCARKPSRSARGRPFRSTASSSTARRPGCRVSVSTPSCPNAAKPEEVAGKGRGTNELEVDGGYRLSRAER